MMQITWYVLPNYKVSPSIHTLSLLILIDPRQGTTHDHRLLNNPDARLLHKILMVAALLILIKFLRVYCVAYQFLNLTSMGCLPASTICLKAFTSLNPFWPR